MHVRVCAYACVCVHVCVYFGVVGASSINQAIKAVAIARGYLEENKLELTCYPEFRSDKRTGLQLILSKTVRRPAPTNDKDVQQLKVRMCCVGVGVLKALCI